MNSNFFIKFKELKMNRNYFKSKIIENFYLKYLAGGSFWILYFSYFALVSIWVYFTGTICNLGIIASPICRTDLIEANGSWAGVTPLNPLLKAFLFVLTLKISTFFKYSSNGGEERIDVFDFLLKTLSIILIPFGIFNTTFFVVVFFVVFLVFRICLYAYEIKNSRSHVKIIKNKGQLLLVFFAFVFASVTESSPRSGFNLFFYKLDESSYLDCCNNEVAIGNDLFIVKNKKLPLCIYERSREKNEVCKVYNPIYKSLFYEPISADRRGHERDAL